MKFLAVGVVLLAAPAAALAQHTHQRAHERSSPYAGQESRDIKSLSEKDIAALLKGEGWGLALPAELNGIPGPAHLLELRDEISLTEAQLADIAAAYEQMRAAAVAEGGHYVASERKLEEAFRSRSVTEKSLRNMLRQIEESRATLRYIHLSTHLRMLAILRNEQILRYNELRGYHTP